MLQAKAIHGLPARRPRKPQRGVARVGSTTRTDPARLLRVASNLASIFRTAIRPHLDKRRDKNRPTGRSNFLFTEITIWPPPPQRTIRRIKNRANRYEIPAAFRKAPRTRASKAPIRASRRRQQGCAARVGRCQPQKGAVSLREGADSLAGR